MSKSLSGVGVDPEVATIFNQIKIKKTHKWMTFLIENKKIIKIDKRCENTYTVEEDYEGKPFEDLKNALEVSEPRYVLYDFNFLKADGRNINKLVFLFWCDDNAPMAKKMIYASSKDTIKATFNGVGIHFQANDPSDLDYLAMKTEVENKS